MDASRTLQRVPSDPHERPPSGRATRNMKSDP